MKLTDEEIKVLVEYFSLLAEIEVTTQQAALSAQG